MDITTLSLAKKYANKVAAGFSKVEVQGNNLIFTLNDGTKATMTIPTPEKGSDGISIVDVSIDIDGSLLCHMSDGSTINAGKITEYDLHSQELDNKIVSTRNELERVKNDVLETGTDTDTFIHLEDSAMAEYQELIVDGVCEQETTQGYNVLDLSKKPYNESSSDLNRATITENGGILTVDTTNATDVATIRSKWEDYTSQNSILLPKGSYYTKLILNVVNLSGERKGQLNGNFTLDEDCLITQWFYNIAKGQKDVKLPLLISNDQTKTEYEPYTGGQLSPSPDYPQEIKTITDSVSVKSTGKNLFNEENVVNLALSSTVLYGSSYKGYYASCKEGDVFSLSRNETINNRFRVVFTTEEPANGVKFFGGTDQSTSYDNSLKIENIVAPKDANYIFIYLSNKGDELPSEIQLERNPVVTDYEPYKESLITANLPEGEFIGKINDTYKDTLKVEYNETDGQYHLNLYKNVGKVVLDGSETNYRAFRNSTNTYGLAILPTDVNQKWINVNTKVNISNNFTSKTYNEIYYNDVEGISSDSKNNWASNPFVICINKSRLSSIDSTGVKQWLSTHNTTVYYALETPYKIDLGVVDMPITYNEITNLFTDSDLLPTINAKYYRNFISTVRNLQVNEKALKQELIDINARLSALETAQTSVASESEVVE